MSKAANQARMKAGIRRSCIAFTPAVMKMMKSQQMFSSNPQQLTRLRAVYKIKAKWDLGYQIKICFIGGTQAQRQQVEHLIMQTYWGPSYRIGLKEPQWNASQQESDIRISFKTDTGSWSFLGTEAWDIALQEATCNFAWLDNAVIIHEFGHALALNHEHLSDKAVGILNWTDRDSLIKAFGEAPNFWPPDVVEQNVLNVVDANEYNSSEYDPKSVMHYIFDCQMFKDCSPCATNTCQLKCNASEAAQRTCPAEALRAHGGGKPIDQLSPIDKRVLLEMYPINGELNPIIPEEGGEGRFCTPATKSAAFIASTTVAVIVFLVAIALLTLYLYKK
jgi:hypothetical protein